MARTTPVLVAAFIVMATAPCEAEMAAAPLWAPQIPEYLAASLATWLDHLELPTIAPLMLGLWTEPFALCPFSFGLRLPLTFLLCPLPLQP